MREVHTVSVTGEAPWSNRTVDPLRANRDGTVWSDIVLPGHWVNLLRQIFSALASWLRLSARTATFSVACNAQRTYRYASRCRLPRASSGSQLAPVPAPKTDPLPRAQAAATAHHSRAMAARLTARWRSGRIGAVSAPLHGPR